MKTSASFCRQGARIDELVIDRLGDAEAAGRVLAIDDDEVELPAALDNGQMFDDGMPAGAANNIADEENAQLNRS
jgi:hypothetical protein